MQEKKKGGLLRFITFLAAAYGMLQAIASLMMWEGKRLEKENKDNPKKNYLNFMNGCSRRLKGEAVERIDMTSVMGGVELDLTGAKLSAVTELHVRALMSGVAIKVSPMVEVQDDTRSIMSGVANMVPHYNREDIPVIRLDAECIMSGISIRVVCPEEDNE